MNLYTNITEEQYYKIINLFINYNVQIAITDDTLLIKVYNFYNNTPIIGLSFHIFEQDNYEYVYEFCVRVIGVGVYNYESKCRESNKMKNTMKLIENANPKDYKFLTEQDIRDYVNELNK
jgi:hypothetical protein